MKHLSRIAAALSLGALLAVSLPALADHEPGHDDHAGHDHAGHDHAAPAPAAGAHVPADAHAEGHGDAHGDGHAPTFDDVNWFHGFLGEKEGEEPSLLWRPKGMPVPLGALLLNTAILYFLIFKFGKKPIADALKARQVGIMKGMEEAAKVKAEAEASLAKYQKQLDEIDAEVARIKREAKEQSEAESARIVSEAKERRARMERDARTLIEQELKAAREELLRETVRAAVKSAETSIAAKIGESDQQRLGEEYLASIKASGAALRGRL